MTKWTVLIVFLALCSCSSAEPVVIESDSPTDSGCAVEPDEQINNRGTEEAVYDIDNGRRPDEGRCNDAGPIIIDFIRDKNGEYYIPLPRGIRSTLHRLGQIAGVKIEYEGPELEMPVIYRATTPKAALEAIESICKANQLDMVNEGEYLIIKARVPTTMANVLNSEVEGRYNIDFEEHPLVEAIMEVAKVSNSEVYVPAISCEDFDEIYGSGKAIQGPYVTLTLKVATPDQIFRILAVLGGFNIEEDISNGYSFKYRGKKDE